MPLATGYRPGLLSPKDKAFIESLQGLDYTPQPLPLIGVWSNYQNSPYGLNVYDSDLNFVSATSSSNFAAFNSELGGAYAGWTRTDPRVSSNSATTSWIKGTSAVGADGHLFISAGNDGSYAFRNPGYIDQSVFGVVIGGQGYRQNFSLVQQGLQLRQQSRGKYVVIDTQGTTGSLGQNLGTYANLGSSNANNMRGAVGYNRLTNTLVMLEATITNATNYRAHIYVHPNRKIRGRSADLFGFMDEAVRGVNGATYRYIDFSWATATTNQEALCRARVIPCNNGKISISRMVPSTRIEIGTLVPAASGNSGTFTVKSPSGPVSLTTSYGYDQGMYYGMRHQVSWDNKWVLTYCPYYYYGSGINAFLISVDDPDVYYVYQYATSGDGSQPLPYGTSGFIIGQSDPNSDGNVGCYFTIVSMENNLQPGGTIPAVGGSLTTTTYSGILDVAGTTTNYPCLVPIERWSVPGFAGYPG